MKPNTKTLLVDAMMRAESCEELLREAALLDAETAPDIAEILDMMSDAFNLVAAVLDYACSRDEALN